MNNLETTVKRLLNENVDAALGPRRPAPRLELSAAARQSDGLRPWLVPLLATAGVAAATVAVLAPVQLLSDRSPGGSSRSIGAGSSTSSSAPSRSTTSGGPTVRLGGAALHLPTGWVARDYRSYLTPGSTMTPGSDVLGSQAWCLTPADRPVSKAPFACPVAFIAIADKAARDAVDVDYQGGYLSQPQYCPPQDESFSSARSAEVSFGGRTADFRRFDYRCPSGKQWRIEQYVVASGPGYILSSLTADDRISAAMAQIVAGATLPARTSAVRYYDHGYIRSITPVAGGARITLDRVVPGPDGPVNDNPQTYGYFVPQSAKPDGLRVGELISLFTDGSQVTEYYSSF